MQCFILFHQGVLSAHSNSHAVRSLRESYCVEKQNKVLTELYSLADRLDRLYKGSFHLKTTLKLFILSWKDT